MVNLTKAAGAIILALLLPACGKTGPEESVPSGLSPGANPDRITVSVQNNDSTPYDLAIREFVNGVLSAEVRIAWPIAAAAAGAPSHAEGTWNFHADGPPYTHSVILYDVAGPTLDEQPFVKGPGQLTLIVTITGAKLDVSP